MVDESSTTGAPVVPTKGKRTVKGTVTEVLIDPVKEQIPAAPASKPSVPTWVQDAAAMWNAVHGGVVQHAKLGAHLKALVHQYGWERVRPVWGFYLDEAKEKASGADFVAKFGTYEAKSKGMNLIPIRSDPKAEQKRAAMTAMIMGGLKGDGTFGGDRE